MKFKDTLIGTITKIINVSLTMGQYLDEWKRVVVRPLIKGPNLDTEYKNYHPISNLSFVSKLIEKAAQTQLMTHFTEHNLLPKHQNAYRKNFSTETAILNICDNIWTSMENTLNTAYNEVTFNEKSAIMKENLCTKYMPFTYKYIALNKKPPITKQNLHIFFFVIGGVECNKLTSIICFDLSAAFDTVNHSILLEVMRNYFGIANMALDWISCYLRNRKFSVHIDSFSSNTKTINFSIPQGSILGPTLFNCYVSTLMEIIPENEENFVSGYADNHAIINTFHPENIDISPKLVSDICIKDWMNRNQLKMNDAKTEFIVFGSKHQVQRNDLKSLNIDNTTVKAKLVIKFLDAFLDESLNMKIHISNRTKNALYNLYLIKKHQEIYYP